MVFSQRNTRVKILIISFEEFWDLLRLAFNKHSEVTFERYNFLNRKQIDRESFEQFLGSIDGPC